MNPHLVGGGYDLRILIIGVDAGVRPRSLPHPLNELNVSLGEAHMLIVQLVEELCPPLWVILSLDKLFKLVLFRHFLHFLARYRVALMLVKIIPVLRYIACSDKHFFVG